MSDMKINEAVKSVESLLHQFRALKKLEVVLSEGSNWENYAAEKKRVAEKAEVEAEKVVAEAERVSATAQKQIETDQEAMKVAHDALTAKKAELSAFVRAENDRRAGYEYQTAKAKAELGDVKAQMKKLAGSFA